LRREWNRVIWNQFSRGSGITNESIQVENNSFSKTINVSECARGAYTIWVAISGRDGEYGTWSNATNASELIKHVIDDFCDSNVSKLRLKSQDQILAVLQDATINKTGSDDVACVMELNVRHSITVSPLAASLYVGETKQFNATAKDQYGNEIAGIVFNWTSSNITVGTINENGLFTAKAAGTSTVKATNGTVNGTAGVSVEVAPIPAATSSLRE